MRKVSQAASTSPLAEESFRPLRLAPARVRPLEQLEQVVAVRDDVDRRPVEVAVPRKRGSL